MLDQVHAQTKAGIPISAWEIAGIVEWGELFEDHMLIPFTSFVNDFGVSPGTFLTYAAITRHAALYWGTIPKEPNTSVLLQTLLTQGGERNAITNIYKALHIDDKCPLMSLRAYWEEALQRELTDTQWEQALMIPNIISMSSSYNYIQFNYLHHAYLTPAKMAKIYPSAVDRCPISHTGNADFLHMIWTCAQMVEYWETITEALNKVTGWNSCHDMAHFLLGVTRRTPRNKTLNKILNLALMIEKRRLAMCWKSAAIPLVLRWLTDLHNVVLAEQQILMLSHTPAGPSSSPPNWTAFIEGIEIILGRQAM
ncbi:hypothetical protein NDU88_000638 [Pleurodeles waltl]|uniref:Reverse transcriptase zinc-binding domain-containing protein n=1 Tax=Pleurodeles waltl TaxID=8319 RepID=A0AAV7URN8_PLEWA|nr:hypothetical protein NDU88_000638 [Pleurodeles waltl]